MADYKNYSRDIWEYIKDLPYMPSRADRDRLFQDENKRERVKLWDYFFRIRPEDIGKPQREEISAIIKNIRTSIEMCKQREKEILEKITVLKTKALIKAIKKLAWGGFVFVCALYFVFQNFPEATVPEIKYVYGFILFLFWAIIMSSIVGLGYFWGSDIKESRKFYVILKEFKISHFNEIDEDRKRISFLKKEVARLRRHIPEPISGEDARKWLNSEFQKLWKYTKEEVALVRDLINIQGEKPGDEIKNPLSVLGPGELQGKIPRQFSVTVNRDLHKHLGAKQAYQLDTKQYSDLYDVLYGVYFLEYIVVGVDMLVTHSFFYDFIEDKVTSEYTTEQYYTDVVALAIEKEVRKLSLLDNNGKLATVYVEDSPAFTLSLKSGEKHQVSFVNQDYFIKVREKLEIGIDDIGKIYWINQARTIADNVIKALRSYIRKHKTL